MSISVITPQSRDIPESQMPPHTDYSGLKTAVRHFLVLPEIPEMLEKCDGALCSLMKEIYMQGSEPFTRTNELVQLLGYGDAAPRVYYGLPTMARLLLTLCGESEEMCARFKAHNEVTRICKVRASRPNNFNTEVI